jgi:hypothetical protein
LQKNRKNNLWLRWISTTNWYDNSTNDETGVKIMPTIVRTGRANKQARRASIVKSNKPPLLVCIYAALHAGKIDEEEAKELHPRFDPNRQIGRLERGKYKRTQAMTYRPHYRGAASLAPSCTDIQFAVEGGYITEEEGKDLNKNYKPEIALNLVHYRKMVKAITIKESGVGKTPSLVNVHRAYKQGFIKEEEASALNSEYDLSNKNRIMNLDANLRKQDSGYYRDWEVKNKGVIKK